MKKRLITSALPYVNNIPHLGNLIHRGADVDMATFRTDFRHLLSTLRILVEYSPYPSMGSTKERSNI